MGSKLGRPTWSLLPKDPDFLENFTAMFVCKDYNYVTIIHEIVIHDLLIPIITNHLYMFVLFEIKFKIYKTIVVSMSCLFCNII